MKKLFVFCFLIFVFTCSVSYGQIDWRGLKNKSASEVTIEAISSYDPVFAKILKDPGLRSELKAKIEEDGDEEGNVTDIMFDAIFGAILKDDSNTYMNKVKAASSIEEYDDLIGPSSIWVEEGMKAIAVLGEDFNSLLNEMRNRFGESFFSKPKIEELLLDSDDDAKNDLPGIDDVTEMIFKAYRKGVITYAELESIWEKTKRIAFYLAPNYTKLYIAPYEKFYPEIYREMFTQKLEDYIKKNDEL